MAEPSNGPNFRIWHFCDVPVRPHIRRYWDLSGPDNVAFN